MSVEQMTVDKIKADYLTFDDVQINKMSLDDMDIDKLPADVCRQNDFKSNAAQNACT
jgi:hypothetical protein